jgi:hypothetical protein
MQNWAGFETRHSDSPAVSSKSPSRVAPSAAVPVEIEWLAWFVVVDYDTDMCNRIAADLCRMGWARGETRRGEGRQPLVLPTLGGRRGQSAKKDTKRDAPATGTRNGVKAATSIGRVT